MNGRITVDERPLLRTVRRSERGEPPARARSRGDRRPAPGQPTGAVPTGPQRGIFTGLTILVARTRRRSDRLEILALVLSIVTSGAIWTLIAARAGAFAEWTGAAAGTFTTFVLVFQKTFGPHRRFRELTDLLDDCVKLSTEIRSLDLNSRGEEFYQRWKHFLARLAEAAVGPIDFPPSPGMMMAHMEQVLETRRELGTHGAEAERT